jgi:O-antigen ligase
MWMFPVAIACGNTFVLKPSDRDPSASLVMAELWEEAWSQWQDNPVLGEGAGTYEQYWNEHRPIDHKVRDAHSLYLETLGELGPIGLALLLALVRSPPRSAPHPLAVGAFGAYVAYPSTRRSTGIGNCPR